MKIKKKNVVLNLKVQLFEQVYKLFLSSCCKSCTSAFRFVFDLLATLTANLLL